MAKIYRDIDDPIELEVLKENAQLGNVPNVTTNNQTPTWSMATTLANIVSGETLTKIMGKISKAINVIISHIGNKSNPHGVTKSQVGLSNVENKSSKDILNELEIGGRNLIIGSSKYTKYSPYVHASNETDGFIFMGSDMYMPIEIGETYLFQCCTDGVWGSHVTNGTGGGVTHLFAYLMGDSSSPGTYLLPVSLDNSRKINSETTGRGIWKYTIPDDGKAYTKIMFRIDIHSDGEEEFSYKYWNFKAEKGTQPTDWTPAPEDYEHILTLNKNGSKIGSYSPLNDSTINITVPTKTSELTNDSGYKTTDNNTTYTLTKSGSTISLTGSDGSKTSVTDSNTTYTLSSFGVTATAAELNKLDGCTATVTELNYVDGVTSNIQTQLNNKLSTTGTAAKATADANGQNIADTYIKGLSVSGRTITYTKGDGGTGTITTQDTNTTYSQATSSALGLVKIGYTKNGKNYPVELSNGQMYVNVPWTDTNTTYGVASTSANGLLKQLSGSTSQFMRGDGIWSTIDYNSLINKPTIPSGVQVIDNLTSSSTTASLSANQGRVLKGYLDKKIVVSSTQPSGQQTGDTWYQII